jgi:putative hydrolase of the HAD superfamily
MLRYDLITFDGDDTLWDFHAMSERGMAAAVALIKNRLGTPADGLSVEGMTARVNGERDKQDPQTIDYPAFRQSMYRLVIAELGHPDPETFAAEVMADYLAARDAELILFPGARELLEGLRGRVKLGFMTNGTSTPEGRGFAGLFDVVVTPETLGLRKPDPAVFHHAGTLAGVNAGRALHVGDGLESDVAGALAAGWSAAWFNPGRAENSSPHQPHYTVHDLRDLMRVI